MTPTKWVEFFGFCGAGVLQAIFGIWYADAWLTGAAVTLIAVVVLLTFFGTFSAKRWGLAVIGAFSIFCLWAVNFMATHEVPWSVFFVFLGIFAAVHIVVDIRVKKYGRLFP